MARKQIQSDSGGLVWTAIAFILAFAGMIWFGLYTGLILDSLFGVFLTLILVAMLIGGWVSTGRVDLAGSGPFGLHALSFTIGLILFLIIGSSTGAQSVFSLPSNQLFATIAGELPIELDFLINSFVIPIGEEFLWNFGILGTTFFVLNYAGKHNSFFANPYVQMFIMLIIGGATFAVFHVLKLVTTFLIAAFVFRSIATVLVYGDAKYDWIPYLQVTFAFAIGMHIGNNWADFGFLNGLQILFANFATFGWIVLTFIGTNLALGLNYAFEKVMPR